MNAQPKDICPYWLAGFLDNPLRLWLQNPDAILSGLVTEGETALDLGCGPGVFTQGLARRVGPGGRVVGVDLQQPMLDQARARLKRAGLLDWARFEKCSPERVGLDDLIGQVDFALAFWMVHEVPDPARFLAEACAYLKPSGRLLIVEPRVHVSAQKFQHTSEIVKGLGLSSLVPPRIAISRTALFQKP